MIQGAEHELNFWREFVKTDRFLTGWCGQGKTPELRQEVADFITEHCPKDGSILDCGSGVVSILNGLMPEAYLAATDVLADEYAKIFDYKKHRIPQPVPIGAEYLQEYGYDIVHMSNALDHTQDPVKAYHSMLACVKPGGYLIIQGFENEGEYEKWQGMHQWNIQLVEPISINEEKLTPPHLLITGKNGAINLFVDNSHYHKRLKLDSGKDWFIWIVKK